MGPAPSVVSTDMDVVSWSWLRVDEETDSVTGAWVARRAIGGRWELSCGAVPIDRALESWADPRRWWELEGITWLAVPSSVDPTVVAAAVPYAAVRESARWPAGTDPHGRDLDETRLEGTDEVVLPRYGLTEALVHLELNRRHCRVGVRVHERGRTRSRAARALGARPAAAQDDDAVPLRVALRPPEPTRESVRCALGILAEETWRFMPLLTAALTAEEVLRDSWPDPADQLGIAVAA